MLESFPQGDAAYQGGRVELFFNLCFARGEKPEPGGQVLQTPLRLLPAGRGLKPTAERWT